MSAEFAREYWSLRSPEWDGRTLTSGAWQGHVWQHDLTFNGPRSDTLILHVTGGVPNEVDESLANQLAERSGLGVATLYGIPNQPLFDRTEDDLIAYTFDQFLSSGDPTWPLLLPMTRAALAAMDVLPAERFIVTGSSKRGWTTWLAGGSGDSRIVGLVPRVFDNLNLIAQLRHQMELWGEYSPMIQPYIDHNLQDRVGSPRGQELARMVDPLTYAGAITCPVYAMHGLNDPYWTVDAHTLYWDQLAMPRAMFGVPNTPHNHGDSILAHPSIAAFCRLVAQGKSLPTENPDRQEIWRATGHQNRFAESEWTLNGSTQNNVAEVTLSYFGDLITTSAVRILG
ncbi:MAG: hypothetical protein JNJ45_10240 [Chthonomonas sp.]|nr:hypothetical protein [Chthonomonas sp.]